MFVQVSAGMQGDVPTSGKTGRGAVLPCARPSGAPAHLTRVKVHNVQGSFSFSASGSVSSATPGVLPAHAAPNASGWDLAVGGAVARAYVTHLSAAARSSSCEGLRPADVRAAERAGVEGVSVRALLDRAGACVGANIVSFTSVDGFVVRLPLDYVLDHASFVASHIDGAPVRESEGCANQLWIEGAPAHYAVRNVVRIDVERVPAAKVPASPDAPLAGGDFAINPNVGVLNGIMKGAQQGAIA